MLYAYPYVPIAGTVRIGIVIFSYLGASTLASPAITTRYRTSKVLTQGIESGIAELLELADRPPQTTRSAPAKKKAGVGGNGQDRAAPRRHPRAEAAS